MIFCCSKLMYCTTLFMQCEQSSEFNAPSLPHSPHHLPSFLLHLFIIAPPNIMLPDPNQPPTTIPPPSHPSAFHPADVRLQMNKCVCVCVFMCPKGSGLVARTIGPPTAFCSDALSSEPPSKHHGKTIKTSSKSLLPSFFLSLFVLLSLSLSFTRFISPSQPLHLYLSLFQAIFT